MLSRYWCVTVNTPEAWFTSDCTTPSPQSTSSVNVSSVPTAEIVPVKVVTSFSLIVVWSGAKPLIVGGRLATTTSDKARLELLCVSLTVNTTGNVLNGPAGMLSRY